MKYSKINIESIDNRAVPLDLLELADPSKTLINSYLKTGKCFAALYESTIIGILVLKEIDTTTLEVKNLAVKELEQGKGVGTKLLRFAHQLSKELGCQKLIIGTGNSSVDQLRLYQREGFEVDRIDKNFFIRNYEEPIFENGIQCKHMIVLSKDVK